MYAKLLLTHWPLAVILTAVICMSGSVCIDACLCVGLAKERMNAHVAIEHRPELSELLLLIVHC